MTEQIEYQSTDGSFLYRLFDQHDKLLYVGIATNPKDRWQSHYAKEWWSQVARKTVEWHDTRQGAEQAEAKAISDEHPRHNKLHNKRNGIAMTVAKSQFSTLVDRAIWQRETAYITKNGKRVAALVPVCSECGELICYHHDHNEQ